MACDIDLYWEGGTVAAEAHFPLPPLPSSEGRWPHSSLSFKGRPTRAVLEDMFYTVTGCASIASFMALQQQGRELCRRLIAGSSFTHPDVQPIIPPMLVTWWESQVVSKAHPGAFDPVEVEGGAGEPPQLASSTLDFLQQTLSVANAGVCDASHEPMKWDSEEVIADRGGGEGWGVLSRCDRSAIENLRFKVDHYFRRLRSLIQLTKRLKRKWGKLNKKERAELQEVVQAERRAHVKEQDIFDCFTELCYRKENLSAISDDFERCQFVKRVRLFDNPLLTSIPTIPPRCETFSACACSIDTMEASSSSLYTLSLSYNRIRDLDFISHFPHLRVLEIDFNQLSSLQHVILCLQRHPVLSEVSLLGNPISFLDDYRRLVASTCPQLVRLDHRPIEASDSRPLLGTTMYYMLQKAIKAASDPSVAPGGEAAAAAYYMAHPPFLFQPLQNLTAGGGEKDTAEVAHRPLGFRGAATLPPPESKPEKVSKVAPKRAPKAGTSGPSASAEAAASSAVSSLSPEKYVVWQTYVRQTIAASLEILAIRDLSSLQHKTVHIISEEELRPHGALVQYTLQQQAHGGEGGSNSNLVLPTGGLSFGAAPPTGGAVSAAPKSVQRQALYTCESFLSIHGSWGGDNHVTSTENNSTVGGGVGGPSTSAPLVEQDRGSHSLVPLLPLSSASACLEHRGWTRRQSSASFSGMVMLPSEDEVMVKVTRIPLLAEGSGGQGGTAGNAAAAHRSTGGASEEAAYALFEDILFANLQEKAGEQMFSASNDIPLSPDVIERLRRPIELTIEVEDELHFIDDAALLEAMNYASSSAVGGSGGVTGNSGGTAGAASSARGTKGASGRGVRGPAKHAASTQGVDAREENEQNIVRRKFRLGTVTIYPADLLAQIPQEVVLGPSSAIAFAPDNKEVVAKEELEVAQQLSAVLTKALGGGGMRSRASIGSNSSPSSKTVASQHFQKLNIANLVATLASVAAGGGKKGGSSTNGCYSLPAIPAMLLASHLQKYSTEEATSVSACLALLRRAAASNSYAGGSGPSQSNNAPVEVQRCLYLSRLPLSTSSAHWLGVEYELQTMRDKLRQLLEAYDAAVAALESCRAMEEEESGMKAAGLTQGGEGGTEPMMSTSMVSVRKSHRGHHSGGAGAASSSKVNKTSHRNSSATALIAPEMLLCQQVMQERHLALIHHALRIIALQSRLCEMSRVKLRMDVSLRLGRGVRPPKTELELQLEAEKAQLQEMQQGKGGWSARRGGGSRR